MISICRGSNPAAQAEKSWRIPILKCRGSNPPAPASQPVSNVSHMKVAQKLRSTARFRGYDSVSVCEFRPWKRHFDDPALLVKIVLFS